MQTSDSPAFLHVSLNLYIVHKPKFSSIDWFYFILALELDCRYGHKGNRLRLFVNSDLM